MRFLRREGALHDKVDFSVMRRVSLTIWQDSPPASDWPSMTSGALF